MQHTPLEEESDENLDREIETMIECTEFVGNLMNKNKRDKTYLDNRQKKFQHVLQTDEMLQERIQIDEKLLNKKRRKINIELEEDDGDNEISAEVENIFESSWRS